MTCSPDWTRLHTQTRDLLHSSQSSSLIQRHVVASTLNSRKHPALMASKARYITATARLPSFACLLSNSLPLCAQNYIRMQTSSIRSLCPHSWKICCIASSSSAWAKDDLFSREIHNTKDKQGDEQVANTSPSKQSLCVTDGRLGHN